MTVPDRSLIRHDDRRDRLAHSKSKSLPALHVTAHAIWIETQWCSSVRAN